MTPEKTDNKPTNSVASPPKADDSQTKTVAPPDAGGRPTLTTKVYSPYKTYFEQEAYSISAVNDNGPFDILPQHHNFITLLRGGDLSVDSPAGPMTVRIAGGLMHVRGNNVVVFLDV